MTSQEIARQLSTYLESIRNIKGFTIEQIIEDVGKILPYTPKPRICYRKVFRDWLCYNDEYCTWDDKDHFYCVSVGKWPHDAYTGWFNNYMFYRYQENRGE